MIEVSAGFLVADVPVAAVTPRVSRVEVVAFSSVGESASSDIGAF